MGRRLVSIRLTGFDPSLGRALLLAALFLAGALLGHIYAGFCDAAALSAYLRDYCAVYDGGGVTVSLSSCIVLYFGCVAAVFLLGFASIGALLLPFVTGAFGFFLSFSVCCFTAAFGPEGVLLALAVFGLRCAVTLPGYFLLAVPAWEHSAALASLSFGRSRSPVVYGRAWWGRLAAVCVLLLAGMCAELMLSPRLVGLLAERLLAA